MLFGVGGGESRSVARGCFEDSRSARNAPIFYETVSIAHSDRVKPRTSFDSSNDRPLFRPGGFDIFDTFPSAATLEVWRVSRVERRC